MSERSEFFFPRRKIYRRGLEHLQTSRLKSLVLTPSLKENNLLNRMIISVITLINPSLQFRIFRLFSIRYRIGKTTSHTLANLPTGNVGKHLDLVHLRTAGTHCTGYKTLWGRHNVTPE